MAKLSLFEYVVLLHPKPGKKDEEPKEDTRVIVEPKTQLAKNDKTLALHAARAIPEEFEDDLDRIEIIVRPF